MNKASQIFLGVALTTLLGITTTFMYRADDKLYALVQAQTRLAGEINTLTAITKDQLANHQRSLKDHEDRLRTLEN